MSMIGMVRDVAEVFLWIGSAGSAIAVLCALLALFALARGAAGLAGGAAAIWIGGALLSLTSGFSGQWIPPLVAVGALVMALIVGGLLRPVVRTFEARPKVELPDPAASASSASSPAPRRVVGVRTVAPESIR